MSNPRNWVLECSHRIEIWHTAVMPLRRLQKTTTVLLRSLPNFNTIRNFWRLILCIWEFVRSYDRASFTILQWPSATRVSVWKRFEVFINVTCEYFGHMEYHEANDVSCVENKLITLRMTKCVFTNNVLNDDSDLLLIHWGRMTHICVGKLTIIGSDNGLSPGRRLAIIWTNAGIVSIGPLGTNFNEISIGIKTFSFKKMHFKMSSAKWRPFCLGLNVLIGLTFLLVEDL